MTTTPLLMNELSSLFAQFEVNGDGSITAQEVEQVLTSMAAVIAPEEADALRQLLHEQKIIRRDDFLQWAQHQPKLGRHQLLRDLFDLVDADHNGWLLSLIHI